MGDNNIRRFSPAVLSGRFELLLCRDDSTKSVPDNSRINNTANPKIFSFNKSLNNKLPHMAALEMLNSRWYVQTPKRVEKLINLLLE